ncbi:MAG TPA: glycosyltransferase [bacterium]|nr:glycosyltransferase [bacterium]
MNSYCIMGPVAPLRGGIAHYTTLLAEELKNKGEVNVISFSRLYPSLLFPGKSQVVENGALKPPPNVDFSLDTMNPLTWIAAAKKIAAMKPDMLIVPLWVTFLVPPFLAIVSSVRRHSSAKVLFICHNVIPHDVSRVHLLLVKMLLKRGDFAIVHSDREMALVRSAVPTVRVMKHFHPTYDFFASAGEHEMTCEEARDNLRISKDKLVLLFFGFVRRYKGLDLLIEAMPKVCKCVDAELLIVGEFWEKRVEYERMIERASLQQNIRIIDRYVPDNEVALYFTAADIVILPYREATQSGVVQIAYAFCKPVITTDVGGLPEVVHDGRTGYVVPSEEPDAIADAVLRFSRERASVDFAGNIEAVKVAFSWAVITRSIEQCLM